MIFFMARTSRGMKGELEARMDEAIGKGGWSLALLAALAVGREGLETALFLWAAAKATGSTTRPLAGGALGIAVAVVLGVLIYRGAVRLDLAKFFRWTGVFLIFIAAGVLAYGVHDLQEAGILPGLTTWPSTCRRRSRRARGTAPCSRARSTSPPRTTWLELVVWFAYVIPVLTLFILTIRKKPVASTPTPLATSVAS